MDGIPIFTGLAMRCFKNKDTVPPQIATNRPQFFRKSFLFSLNSDLKDRVQSLYPYRSRNLEN